MALNYNEFIQTVLQPEIQDTVFYRNLQDILGLFTEVPTQGGENWETKFRLAYSSNAAQYTTADSSHVASSSQTLAKPYWAKTFYQSFVEVENIDIKNAMNGGADFDLVRDAVAVEAKALMDKIAQGILVQIKDDVDDTNTYSDLALSRSTYPTLASAVDTSTTAITVELFREMVDGATLEKNAGPLSNYVALFEQGVYNTFKRLAGDKLTYTVNDVKAGQALAGGYQEINSFDGIGIAAPEGLVSGDVFLLRKQDVKVDVHRPLEIVPVPTGKDSVGFALYAGADVHVINPGRQGKMTNKS